MTKLSRNEKLEEIIIYMISLGVCKEFASIPEQIIRISNILYLIDMDGYRKYERPVTGVRYFREEWGARAEGLEDAFAYLLKSGNLHIISYAEFMSSVAP